MRRPCASAPAGKLTQRQAELSFAEAKAKSERRLDFRTFLAALAQVAAAVGGDFAGVSSAVKSVEVPAIRWGDVPRITHMPFSQWTAC